MEKEIIMKKKHLLPMNLQLFAEGDDNPEITPPAFNVDELTDEQLASIREKHGFKTDDDVNEIIKGKHAKWKKETEERENEAARLAKLSEEERQQAIIDKEKADFEAEKAEFRKEQLLVEKGKQLLNEGLPSDFANRVLGETAEEASADIKILKKSWDAAIEKAVNERLKHSAEIPGAGSNQPGDNNPWSKASFNLTRQGEILREDPERAKLLQQTAIK